jgi:predicted secreted hydrolase
LRADEVGVLVLANWTSPQSKARYPSHWRLVVPSADLRLDLEPLLEDQEMRNSFVYWEGAVRATGTSGGVPVEGKGYFELTGYAKSMQGLF